MALTDRQQGISGSVAIKPACYVASTANLTLSSTQVVDGIAVGSCERVLVKDQTDTTENGIYIADTASWSRTKDFDGASDAIPGSLVYVDRGTAYGRTFWAFNSSSTATSINIGTTQIIVSQITQALGVLPLTTKGDLIHHDGSAAARLAIGATNTVLTSTGTEASWSLIGSANISTGAVTSEKIADSAVSSTLIATGAVTGPKVAMGSDAHGDILYRGSTAYARLAAGSSGQILKTLGSTNPVWADGGGLIQVASTQIGIVVATTEIIPQDDTIPQSDEGVEVMTLAITPKSATNRMKLDVVVLGSISAGSGYYVGVFQDTSTNAIAAGGSNAVTGAVGCLAFSYDMVSGTTAVTTFKVRAGAGSAATFTLNGFGGVRKLGGVAVSSLRITEYLP